MAGEWGCLNRSCENTPCNNLRKQLASWTKKGHQELLNPPAGNKDICSTFYFCCNVFLGHRHWRFLHFPKQKKTEQVQNEVISVVKMSLHPMLMLEGWDDNPIIHHVKLYDSVSCTCLPANGTYIVGSWILRFMCTFLSNPSSTPSHNVTRLRAANVNQTFHSWSQWRLAWQVGTLGDTEWILLCRFRLHKHHYHLTDLELLRCSAATPILSETLNGDAHGLLGTRAIESTKRNFS